MQHKVLIFFNYFENNFYIPDYMRVIFVIFFKKDGFRIKTSKKQTLAGWNIEMKGQYFFKKSKTDGYKRKKGAFFQRPLYNGWLKTVS